MPSFPENIKYYRPIHFRIEELVPAGTYRKLERVSNSRGDMERRALQLLDWRILYTIDCIREQLRIPLIVNDWYWGGEFQYRGWRPPACTVGAINSQHKFGRAIDFVSPRQEAEQIRLKILENNRLFPYITYMEDGTTWVHIDCRNADVKHIHLFQP